MIKIGQIGMAHDHAEGKMNCVRKFPEVFKVVGIAEENPEVIKKYGNRPCYRNIPVMSVDELLNIKGLDAVMVETDELSLVHFAQKCIDNDVHVHIDKPAGGNVEDFERLLCDAKRKNLIVQLAYMYRYNPAVQYCANAVKNGKLGEIFRVQAIMNTMMLDFARMIEEDKENPYTYEYELLVQKAVLAACSLPIKVEYTNI